MTPTAPSGRISNSRPLGREVRLHVAVEVEVIAGQVGEDAGGEAQLVRAAQRERVRRDLHHARAAAFLQHVAQHLLQLGRFGRRPRRVELARADAVADRCPIRPHLMPAASKIDASTYDVVVLPLVPVMPTSAELLAGMAGRRRRDLGERRARGGTWSLGHGDAGRRGRLRNHRNRALRDPPAARTGTPSALTPRRTTNSAPGLTARVVAIAVTPGRFARKGPVAQRHARLRRGCGMRGRASGAAFRARAPAASGLSRGRSRRPSHARGHADRESRCTGLARAEAAQVWHHAVGSTSTAAGVPCDSRSAFCARRLVVRRSCAPRPPAAAR
jgi:hypothetical protein